MMVVGLVKHILDANNMNKQIQDILFRQKVMIGEDGEIFPNLITEVEIEQFALDIVKECIMTIQREIVRNGNTPENLRSRKHLNDIATKFGIEFPIYY